MPDYPASDDPLVQALQRLLQRAGGHVAVGDAAGINDQSLYQIATVRADSKTGQPKGVGPSIRKRLSAAYPDWLDTPDSSSTQHAGGVDQPLSLEIRQTPPRITWGELRAMRELPETFELEMSDSSMGAVAPKGTVVKFKRSTEVAHGEGVLRDKRGDFFFRQCRPKVGGGWVAHPLNAAFPPLDSEVDGLVVVALMVGIEIGLSQLL